MLKVAICNENYNFMDIDAVCLKYKMRLREWQRYCTSPVWILRRAATG
jgi:hypothetical protein